ncbi:hypothetical protein THS27_08325 [Thalassospira sp. MCCC 1A01428]|nr:hypothetical protein THS27_08325 [Thalassospira sp. MCCC 1A01428]
MHFFIFTYPGHGTRNHYVLKPAHQFYAPEWSRLTVQDYFVFHVARKFAGRAFIVLLAMMALPFYRAQANSLSQGKCLVMAMPEVLGPQHNYENYILAMAQAGLCVDPVWMPNQRAVLALETGHVDGIFARPAGFQDEVSVSVLSGASRVGRVSEMLVTKDAGITGLGDLRNQSVGVWLGSKWSDTLLANHPNVVRVPGGPVMMQGMIRKGHIDAMLLDGYSLDASGGVPPGFHARSIGEITVYSWVLARHRDYLPKLDAGTVIFRQQLLKGGAKQF